MRFLRRRTSSWAAPRQFIVGLLLLGSTVLLGVCSRGASVGPPSSADDEMVVRAELWSAGLGVSALDGLLRLDVARTLHAPIDWRVHLYLGGLL